MRERIKRRTKRQNERLNIRMFAGRAARLLSSQARVFVGRQSVICTNIKSAIKKSIRHIKTNLERLFFIPLIISKYTNRIRLVERMSRAPGVRKCNYILISILTPAGRSRLESESIVRSEGSIISISLL